MSDWRDLLSNREWAACVPQQQQELLDEMVDIYGLGTDDRYVEMSSLIETAEMDEVIYPREGRELRASLADVM